jgi:hypothetical protein
MITTRHELIAIARDPSLIPGIHEACDQWCEYCPATARCLAYRASRTTMRNAVWDPCGEGLQGVAAGMMMLKALAQVEGRRAPPEIETMMTRGSKEHIVAALDDPLEHLGRNYMDVSEAYLASRTDIPVEFSWRASGPTELEVFVWYHALAPARVFRALVCASEAASGVEGRATDALRAAKVALIGIDRSLAAVRTLADTDDDPRLEFLLTHLPRLRDDLERRFPKARQFRREGLDPGGMQRLRSLLRRVTARRAS